MSFDIIKFIVIKPSIIVKVEATNVAACGLYKRVPTALQVKTIYKYINKIDVLVIHFNNLNRLIDD